MDNNANSGEKRRLNRINPRRPRHKKPGYTTSKNNGQKKLTNRQRRLIDEYVVDMDLMRAYKASGYKGKSYHAASEIFHYPHVQAYLREKQLELRERNMVEADDVIKELARIGFSNMRDYAEWNGTGLEVKSSDEISVELTSCIQEISETSNKFGASMIKLKLHPKINALKMLGEYLGLFREAQPTPEEALELAHKIKAEVDVLFDSVPTEPPPTRKVVKLEKSKK